MSSSTKRFVRFSLLISLMVTFFPVNQSVYAEEKTELTKESTIEKTKETKSTNESQEVTTKTSDTKEVEKGKEESSEEAIKIQPFAAGQPLRPEHLYYPDTLVQVRFQYPTGAPVENLDVELELRDTTVGGGGPMPSSTYRFSYNSTTQLYECVVRYPYAFPYSPPPSVSYSITMQSYLIIRNLDLATSITENYKNTITTTTRRSGFYGGITIPSFDPDNPTVGSITNNPVGLYKQADKSWIGYLSPSTSISYSASREPASITNYKPATPFSFNVNYNYMTEHIVNEKGDTIAAPTGFWNYRQWYINTPTTLYEFGRTNVVGPKETDVPMKYVAGGITYNYEGWYTGWTKPSTLNTAHPITVNVKQNEGFPITVVYSSHVLKTEKYYKSDGTSLESGLHDKTAEEVPLDSTFTGTPKNIIKASNGDYYVYQGWLKDTELPGTDTPRSGKPNEAMTQNTEFKYVYKKATPSRSLSLTPNTTHIASGDQVTWTAKVKNTSVEAINLDDTDMRLLSVPDYVSGSTVVDGVPQSDSFWTGTSIPLIGPGGEVTIQFKTQHVGVPNSYHGTVISAESTKVSRDIARGNVRIKDEDSKPVPPTADIGLENVPSKFVFEDVTVNNYSQVSLLKLSSYASHTISDGLFVRLFDDRAGAPGWRLTAKLDSFKQAAHPSRTLSTGVSMDFKSKLEQVNNPNTSTETIDPSPAGSLPTIQSTVHLSSNNTDVLVMNSPIGIGDGTWQARIPLNDVQLTLPANSGIAGETYESTLTWTLSDAP
ncbi:WxL domain-containing protein [Enterococcus sp. AZ007]|uniref:WxL domain-containing protein n=1 Tax=Enterococcus sp. AZ007 TaxID=2774839 RepID=UPI003F24F7AF